MSAADKKETKIPRAFGRAVKRERLKRGWTQEQLAERARLAPQSFGRMERSVEEPKASTIRRIAKALDVSADRLLGTGPLPDQVSERLSPTYLPSSIQDARSEIRKLRRALRSALTAAKIVDRALKAPRGRL